MAKTLRVSMTDAERRLWSRLRREQLGAKFRRQHAIGSFIVDFVCLDPKLVIEIDGSQHLDQAAYDQRRSDYLNRQGFQVLRFWANEALAETDAIVSSIQQALLALRRARPHPSPPPVGEGAYKNMVLR